ncbi:hypothetical protein SORBI_3007G007250 [Sorghum bicolor]|uniref:Uncharacterized protein n=1 Tax=Sorghum bicolor TaxID=4558 RepID=A0A1Z5R7L6_SORBI|nr:hypothetical protein SORBI_3007G007250 [Sorghum bicolor]
MASLFAPSLLPLSLCGNEGNGEEETGRIRWRAAGFNGGWLDPTKDNVGAVDGLEPHELDDSGERNPRNQHKRGRLRWQVGGR